MVTVRNRKLRVVAFGARPSPTRGMFVSRRTKGGGVAFRRVELLASGKHGLNTGTATLAMVLRSEAGQQLFGCAQQYRGPQDPQASVPARTR
jgi:hypothetical protein